MAVLLLAQCVHSAGSTASVQLGPNEQHRRVAFLSVALSLHLEVTTSSFCFLGPYFVVSSPRFIQGAAVQNPYSFYHWQYIDIFVYFSHHTVTIPPVGWTNAAHRHGVCVLGKSQGLTSDSLAPPPGDPAMKGLGLFLPLVSRAPHSPRGCLGRLGQTKACLS